MLTARKVYRNGEFVPWERATVHVMSHSFGRGSAIFEVLSVHSTAAGPVVFRLREHMDRLFESARLLAVDLPLGRQELLSAVCETVRRNRIESGFVKVMAYFSQVALDILPPDRPLDVSIFALDPAADFPGLSFALDRGTGVCISGWCKLDRRTVPVAAKAAANYLNGMISRQEALSKGFEHAVMLDTEGFVAEGGTESVFLVEGGRVATPALGTVLAGITRDSILKVAAAMQIAAVEERLAPGRLEHADEIFLTGTPVKVIPVRRLEARTLAPVPGPVTRRLSEQMERIVSGREDSFSHWLTPVD